MWKWFFAHNHFLTKTRYVIPHKHTFAIETNRVHSKFLKSHYWILIKINLCKKLKSGRPRNFEKEKAFEKSGKVKEGHSQQGDIRYTTEKNELGYHQQTWTTLPTIILFLKKFLKIAKYFLKQSKKLEILKINALISFRNFRIFLHSLKFKMYVWFTYIKFKFLEYVNFKTQLFSLIRKIKRIF